MSDVRYADGSDFHRNIRHHIGAAERASIDAGGNAGLVKAIANAAGALAWSIADLADAVRSNQEQRRG